MATIKQLSEADIVENGDQFPFFSEAQGDTRKVTFATLKDSVATDFVSADALAAQTGATLVGCNGGTTVQQELDAKVSATLDTDGTLAANSDARVASQKATKAYVDAKSTALAASGGSALVGYIANGTGAVARTAQAKLREEISRADYDTWANYLTAIPTGFFSQNGADIHRFGRVMAGAAQRSDLAFPNVQTDWFTDFQVANGFAGGAILSAQIAAMNDGSTSETGAVGGLFAIQSKNFASIGTSAIGLSAHVVNNHASLATLGWGFYVEAHKTSAAAGPVYAIELDARTTVVSITAHPWQQGDVVGLQAAAGAEFGSTGQDASVGIQFAKNPDKWKVGINFMHDSITGASAGSGSAPAIRMAPGHEIQWVNSAGARVAGFDCDATLTTSAILKFSNGGAAMRRTSGEIIFDFTANASAVNYISVGNNTTGNSPYLAALGNDANIDFQIAPKGTGVLRFGTWTSSGDAAVNGYVTIKDSAGNTRKLATIA